MVLLPSDAPVSVEAHAVIGDVHVLNEKGEGFGSRVRHTAPRYEVATRKVKIVASQVIGEVKIQ